MDSFLINKCTYTEFCTCTAWLRHSPLQRILTLPDTDGAPTSVTVFGVFVYVFDCLQYAKLLEDEVYPLFGFYLWDA